MGNKILFLGENLPPEAADAVFAKYGEIVDAAEKYSQQLADEINCPREIITEGLLVRAKDILKTAADRLSSREKSEEAARQVLSELGKESRREQAISGLFRELVDLLSGQNQTDVDIKNLGRKQDTVLKQMEMAGGKSLLLRVLKEQGHLKPVPEIFWRVDRDLNEHRKRFGLDVRELCEQTVGLKIKGKKSLLEFGPGNGRSKKERTESEMPSNYTDMALTDSLYYPLNGLVENLIDWEKLEQAVGEPISVEDRKLLSDAIYKVMVIERGEAEKDAFVYNEELVKMLTDNPEKIKDALLEVAPQLGAIKQIPDNFRTADSNGQFTYPRKKLIVGEQCSQAFLSAKKLLTEQTADYLRLVDVYEAMPAYPAGMMIGDFSRVVGLKNGSVDVALGVRSTVYKKGESYQDFILAVIDKLSADGIYIDDNVRENFGVSDRAAQLLEIEKQWKKEHPQESIAVNLILGPGIEGEDDQKGSVPMAVVVSKEANYTSEIVSLLDSGYRLVDLEEYVSGKKIARAA